jgi:hypothetical protein
MGLCGTPVGISESYCPKAVRGHASRDQRREQPVGELTQAFGGLHQHFEKGTTTKDFVDYLSKTLIIQPCLY